MIPAALLLTASAPTIEALTIDATITAADTTRRTLVGRVLTYGETGNTSIGPARFAAGALAATDPTRIKLLIEHDPTQVVGYATATEDRDGALWATFQVAAGAAGDEVLASAAGKLRDGLSVGVQVVTATTAADGALEVTAAAWRETSVVALPAFPSGQVTGVRAAAPAPAPVVPAQPQRLVYATARAIAPRTWAQASDEMAAAFMTGGVAGLMRAALTDVIPPVNAGQRDALLRPDWLGELWQATRTERPIIDALRSSPLTSFKVQGFRVNRPAFGVAEYAGNKAAVPSPGNFSVVPIEALAKRVAGAHDIDRIFLDLGDGAMLRAYFEFQAQNYVSLSESMVSADLLAGATALPGIPPATLLEALRRIVSYLGGIGATTSYIKVASDLWDEALSIKALDAPWLFGGSASLKDGTASIGDLKIVAEPSLAAGSVLAGDGRAATFYEWRNPPLRVEAVNLPNGGVDVGVFGYLALLINDPRAVVSATVDPTP